jgi:ADP-ribosyl-[dinitrogen reductase] hydrolase
MSALEALFDRDLLPTSLQDEPSDSDAWAIASAVIAYAAGDAFGAAHEFVAERPAKIKSILLGKPDWPFGGVSDDTTLSLLTIESLDQDNPETAAKKYLQSLKDARESLRGLGPTTRFALGMSVKPEELHYIGVSNGGMMRTALIGTLFTPTQKAMREAWVRASVQTTHSQPMAIDVALSLSAAFSSAVTHGSSYEVPHPPQDWSPPEAGISLNPLETYRAVTFVVSRSADVESAYLLACELGGDTDTVAALSAALVAASLRQDSGLYQIPWLMDVNWSEIPQMKGAIELLINRRREWAQ